MSCQSAAPFPKQAAWELGSPGGKEPRAEWPGVPVASGQEELSSTPLRPPGALLSFLCRPQACVTSASG